MVGYLCPLLLATGLGAVLASNEGDFVFGVINGDSDYFKPVEQSFTKRCKQLGVTCHYAPPLEFSGPTRPSCAEHRIEVYRDLLARKVHGIAMKPCIKFPEEMKELVDEGFQIGVPTVTFDIDIPNSTRLAYVGTDERFMGRTMARLLRQLRPEGGTYAIIGGKKGRTDGFVEEITKDNDNEDRAKWYEVEKEIVYDEVNGGYLTQMEEYALQKPTAMVIFRQTPMRIDNWTDLVDANRNITFIGTDGSDFQLDYLNRRYVDGLVGQLPYEIGSRSFDLLYEAVSEKIERLDQTFFPTNLVAYNLIPLELPPLDVDQNLVGDLKYVGLVFFGIVALCSLACVAWTLYNRESIIVVAAQPFFLVMLACGVLIMSSTLVPLSFDDKGETLARSKARGICMSIPWLAFTGFTVTFSALFSKTWRVNKFFHSGSSFGRLKVSERDVLAPFVVLLACNVVVLLCWTFLDPLTYDRQFDEGTDYWNREISSSGTCSSDVSAAFLAPLALINFGVLAIACWQAYDARDIQMEFSESKYIGLTVFSLSQAFLTGIPIAVVVRDIPKAFYLVTACLIFVLSLVVLLLIFLPKMKIARVYGNMSESEQRRMMSLSVRRSALGKNIDASQISGMSAVPSGLNAAAAEAARSDAESRDPHLANSIPSGEPSAAFSDNFEPTHQKMPAEKNEGEVDVVPEGEQGGSELRDPPSADDNLSGALSAVSSNKSNTARQSEPVSNGEEIPDDVVERAKADSADDNSSGALTAASSNKSDTARQGEPVNNEEEIPDDVVEGAKAETK